MRRKKGFIKTSILIAIIFALFVGIIGLIFNPSEEQQREESGEDKALVVHNNESRPAPDNYSPYTGYESFEQQLSQNDLVKDLPDNAVLALWFYNFNTGVRIWEKSYVIKRNYVAEGNAGNPDLTIAISSKYVGLITPGNFCSVIQTANQNGDLGIYTDLSKTQLAWKFKSMYKYRDCLGF